MPSLTCGGVSTAPASGDILQLATSAGLHGSLFNASLGVICFIRSAFSKENKMGHTSSNQFHTITWSADCLFSGLESGGCMFLSPGNVSVEGAKNDPDIYVTKRHVNQI